MWTISVAENLASGTAAPIRMGAGVIGLSNQVRRACQIWQDSMQKRFVTTIEELTGRKVAALMSANRQDPDLAVEPFVLERDVF